MKTQESMLTASPTVDIIIVTWNNPQICQRMIDSVLRYTVEPFHIVLVNNGDPVFSKEFCDQYGITLLQMSENKGWMGGINAGIEWCMKNSSSPFIMFANDDIQVMDHDFGWLPKMINCFSKPGIGAVGPTSNAIMGKQSIAHTGFPPTIEATRLSGMCMVVRREVVDKVGLLDESLPGGDDLDYSIRIRKAGYKLAICRRTFLFHHYATTGKRVHGEYWDSREHTEAINKSLINNHGFKTWYATVNDLFPDGGYDFVAAEEKPVLEELGELIENGKVLDLGCGGKKIHPKAIGVDARPKGVLGVGNNSHIASDGDIVAEVSHLPMVADKSVDGILAKHVFEHILDLPKALREWSRVLKDGGKLVIVVPDWRYCEAVSCDPTHVHAFTPESLRSTVEAFGGFNFVRTQDINPGYVLMLVAEKSPARLGSGVGIAESEYMAPGYATVGGEK